LLVVFLATLSANAQFYDSGNDPASLRWKQIKTEHFNILYPLQAENIAQQLANRLESGYLKGAYTLQVLPKKVTVILHACSVLSNAQVAWAPRRMEFVTTPPQDNYPQDWIDQLAAHEYRHLVQITSVNRKFSHVLSWFFGEQVTAGIMGAFVPFWFIEGDATLNETLMTQAGRGRLPSFDVQLRAQLIDKKTYSYDKAVFGSYRDFVPDHYVLGYHLVTMARREFGSGIWDTALRKVAGLPIMITPFNHGIREVSGLSKVKLYKRYLQQLDSIWSEKLDQIIVISSKKISPDVKKYTSFTNPAFGGQSALFAMQSGVDDIRRIVRIDSTGKTRVICTPGYYSYISLSASSSLLSWAEIGYDPRWENRDYSVLWTYDLVKKRKHKLTSRSRYFAPSVSPDSKKVLAASVDLSNINSIAILDSKKGKVKVKKEFPFGEQIITPAWSKDGKNIVFVLLGKQGKQLMMTDSNLTVLKPISKQSNNEISKPIMFGKWIFYSSAVSGIDNIYTTDTLGQMTFQVSSVRFGAYDPCVSADGKFIVYSEYTSDGNILSQIPIDTAAWKPIEKVKDVSPHLFEPLLEQEMGTINYSDSLVMYPSKKYHPFLHLFNLHSWGPISVNATSQTVKPGITIMTQNKLATLIGSGGWEYSINERTGTYFAEASLRMWYPIFDFRFEYGGRSSSYIDSADQEIKYNWKQTSFRAGVRVPLNLSSGKWLTWLQPRVSSTYSKVVPGNNMPDSYFKGFYRTLDYNLYFSNQILTSQKDLFTRWGQEIILDFRHTPLDGYNIGNIMAARTAFYFPGIIRHHSININASWQRNTNNVFKYADIISYPRGLRDKYDDEFWSIGINYSLPLAYPDAHLGSVIYLKRIWTTLFFDNAEGVYDGARNYYRSAGIELYADMHILRFLAPFSIGGRLSWIPDNNTFVPEFLYSLNLNGIQ
jgi:hypothetical protein